MEKEDKIWKKSLETLKSECPCLDCITLGICKGIMSECYGLFPLRDRCSIFDEHYGNRYLIMDSPERKFLKKLFKPRRINGQEGNDGT